MLSFLKNNLIVFSEYIDAALCAHCSSFLRAVEFSIACISPAELTQSPSSLVLLIANDAVRNTHLRVFL